MNFMNNLGFVIGTICAVVVVVCGAFFVRHLLKIDAETDRANEIRWAAEAKQKAEMRWTIKATGTGEPIVYENCRNIYMWDAGQTPYIAFDADDGKRTAINGTYIVERTK